jgi:hydroxyacylglutathione hydrolase
MFVLVLRLCRNTSTSTLSVALLNECDQNLWKGFYCVARALLVQHNKNDPPRFLITLSFSGHSPYTDDPYSAIDTALRRYERWIREPQRLGWHACKRIFTYILMIHHGMDRTTIGSYLPGCHWFQDYSRHIFQLEPDEFIEPLINELVRSQAAAWDGERLVALAPHTPPPADWPPPNTDPRCWE